MSLVLTIKAFRSGYDTRGIVKGMMSMLFNALPSRKVLRFYLNEYNPNGDINIKSFRINLEDA